MRGAALTTCLLASACTTPTAETPRRTTGLGPSLDAELRGTLRCFRGLEEQPLVDILDELREFDVVFVGEKHDDAMTHRVELAIVKGLAHRRPIAVSLEMFERHEQTSLDRYLAGEIQEAEFQTRVDLWSNYTDGYRPLIEFAKATQLPVVAANGPRTLLRKVSRGREAAVAALDPAERALFPRELHPARASYWERYDRLARTHGGSVGPGTEDRLFWTQNLWDNCMGEAIVDARKAMPNRSIVHICGGFHSAFGEGTVDQVRLRAPALRIATVAIQPSHDLARVSARAAQRDADYVLYVDARATDRFSSGVHHAVSIPTPLRWQVPKVANDAANDAVDGPVVLWLPDRGLTSSDALPWLERTLGSDARLVVLEPPARTRFGETAWYDRKLTNAVARIRTGIERILEYLATRRPFDRTRVLVAGEGRAATLLIGMARSARALPWTTLAIAPRDLEDCADAGTANPPIVDEGRRLVILTHETSDYDRFVDLDAEIGLLTTLHALPGRHARAEAVISQLRTLSGLPPRTETRPAPSSLQNVVLRHDDVKSIAWERIVLATRRDFVRVDAAAADADTRVLDFAPVELAGRVLRPALRPADLDTTRLPKSTNAFGGTTLLLVPAHETAEGREAWGKLVAEHGRARSRWPIEVVEASTASDSEYDALMQRLVALDARGVQSALVVPAQFRADPTKLDALRRAIDGLSLQGGMDVDVLSGLGNRIARDRR